jgi:hypothetical protein
MPNTLPTLPFPVFCAVELPHSSLYLMFILKISFLKKGTICPSEKQEPLWTIKRKSLTYFIVISIATDTAKLIFFNYASQHILKLWVNNLLLQSTCHTAVTWECNCAVLLTCYTSESQVQWPLSLCSLLQYGAPTQLCSALQHSSPQDTSLCCIKCWPLYHIPSVPYNCNHS